MDKVMDAMEKLNASVANPDEEQERRFTQEDVDRIVAERVAQACREAEAQIQAACGGNSYADSDAREEELRNRETEITRRELRAEAIDTLVSRGLPRELELLLDYTDPDRCNASIDALERAFRGAVQRGVDERIKNSRNPLPKTGSSAHGSMLTRMRSAAGLRDKH